MNERRIARGKGCRVEPALGETADRLRFRGRQGLGDVQIRYHQGGEIGEPGGGGNAVAGLGLGRVPGRIEEVLVGDCVPAVVASLWPVFSSSTSQLMKAFYERLIRDGHDTATALQRARLTLLGPPESRATARYAHPFFWSPFLVFGDWR